MHKDNKKALIRKKDGKVTSKIFFCPEVRGRKVSDFSTQFQEETWDYVIVVAFPGFKFWGKRVNLIKKKINDFPEARYMDTGPERPH